MRLYELAKSLGVATKELMAKAHELEMPVQNHMCALSPENVADLTKFFRGESGGKAVLTQPAAASHKKTAVVTDHSHKEAPAVISGPKVVPSVPVAEVEKAVPVESQVVGQDKKEAVVTSAQEVAPAPKRKVTVPATVVVKDFAAELGLKPNQVIAQLMMMNVFASINQSIDFKIAQKLAEKYDVVLELERKKPEPKPAAPHQPPHKKKEEKEKEKKVVLEEEDSPANLMPRPPVVAFLGHVDHGKTSLMDKIRNARVAQGEAGGITQHVGAYTVDYHGKKVTFLDTPGHAAFTAMRARGANMTDIVVLVVAADDGIMPQTKEAIKHAQAAGVCMVVALNKVDLPAANTDRVKRQFQQDGLAPEDWGGSLGFCEVSALTGKGIDTLLERILLETEMMELKANPRRRAQGYVIEARMESGRGPTASFLVKKGTLRVGDVVACGACWGKVKALIDDKGKNVKEAGPSVPVRCLGLSGVPDAGAEFMVYANEREARELVEERLAEMKRADLPQARKMSLETLLKETQSNQAMELSIILKVDVKGSLEAIEHALREIKSDKVTLNIILSGVGNITENDVLLASASNAILIGFHVALEPGVTGMAKHEGVEIRLYSIIYELLDEVRDAMTGLLQPEIREKFIGQAEILQIFSLSNKKGQIAGSRVKSGRINLKAKARVRRGNAIIFEGRLCSLKRYQNDANEVREGQECGLRLDNFDDYQVGDVMDFYEVEKIQQKL